MYGIVCEKGHTNTDAMWDIVFRIERNLLS